MAALLPSFELRVCARTCALPSVARPACGGESVRLRVSVDVCVCVRVQACFIVIYFSSPEEGPSFGRAHIQSHKARRHTTHTNTERKYAVVAVIHADGSALCAKDDLFVGWVYGCVCA